MPIALLLNPSIFTSALEPPKAGDENVGFPFPSEPNKILTEPADDLAIRRAPHVRDR
jgi:hypothetical protein